MDFTTQERTSIFYESNPLFYNKSTVPFVFPVSNLSKIVVIHEISIIKWLWRKYINRKNCSNRPINKERKQKVNMLRYTD